MHRSKAHILQILQLYSSAPPLTSGELVHQHPLKTLHLFWFPFCFVLLGQEKFLWMLKHKTLGMTQTWPILVHSSPTCAMGRIRPWPLSFSGSAMCRAITSMWPHQAVHHTHDKIPTLPGLESCNRLSWLNQGFINRPFEKSFPGIQPTKRVSLYCMETVKGNVL